MNKKYIVSESKVMKVINSMPLPKITLDNKEVPLQFQDILNTFKCFICNGIPVAPIHECPKCDALFCDYCISNQKDKQPHMSLTCKGCL